MATNKPVTKGKEVAKVETGAVPAHLLQGKGTFLTGMDSTDFVIPRIVLLQGLSPECETFDDASPGNFWYRGLDQNLGKSFDFVICSNRKYYMLMAPLGDPRKVLARASDGIHWDTPDQEFEIQVKGRKAPVKWKTAATVRESGLDKFGSYNPDDVSNPKPAAVLIYEYLVYLPDYAEISPVVISLARSQVKKAKKELHGKLAVYERQGVPLQGARFTAGIVKEESQEGSYFNWTFTANGFTEETEFSTCLAIADQFKTYRPADEEGIDRDAAGGGGSSSPDDGTKPSY